MLILVMRFVLRILRIVGSLVYFDVLINVELFALSNDAYLVGESIESRIRIFNRNKNLLYFSKNIYFKLYKKNKNVEVATNGVEIFFLNY